jgi:hypothetical protein
LLNWARKVMFWIYQIICQSMLKLKTNSGFHEYFDSDMSNSANTVVYYNWKTVISLPVQSTGRELMSSLVRRRRHPMLTFAFRSNVDKLLGPGWWNFTCEFVVDG